MPDRLMSSELIWPDASQNSDDASTRPAYSPTRGENTTRPAQAVMTTPTMPQTPVHSRACHSPRPNRVKVSAFIHACNGGFSKYLMPFRRVVIQSPLANISRPISA